MVEDGLVAPDADAAHRLVSILDRSGMTIRAALWTLTSNATDWRLWLTPDATIPDKRAFYEQAAKLVSRNRDTLPNFDVGDIEVVPADHVALVALGRMFHIENSEVVRLSKTMLDGYYMDEAIIVRLR